VADIDAPRQHQLVADKLANPWSRRRSRRPPATSSEFLYAQPLAEQAGVCGLELIENGGAQVHQGQSVAGRALASQHAGADLPASDEVVPRVTAHGLASDGGGERRVPGPSHHGAPGVEALRGPSWATGRRPVPEGAPWPRWQPHDRPPLLPTTWAAQSAASAQDNTPAAAAVWVHATRTPKLMSLPTSRGHPTRGTTSMRVKRLGFPAVDCCVRAPAVPRARQVGWSRAHERRRRTWLPWFPPGQCRPPAPRGR